MCKASNLVTVGEFFSLFDVQYCKEETLREIILLFFSKKLTFIACIAFLTTCKFYVSMQCKLQIKFLI